MTPAPLVALAMLGSLTACASTTGEPTRYQQDKALLEADCRERGGILTPSPSGFDPSGNPALDFQCEVRGGGSRLDRSDD